MENSLFPSLQVSVSYRTGAEEPAEQHRWFAQEERIRAAFRELEDLELQTA